MAAARDYELGADGRYLLDGLPFWGQMTTHGLLPGAGPKFGINYVNDSAATATAWATGHKTIEGRLSQGPSSGLSVPGQDFRSVMLDAKAAGKRVANISDVDLTDADPRGDGRLDQRPLVPGAAEHGLVPGGAQGQTAARARSPSSSWTTGSTCCWAAAGTGSRRTWTPAARC